MTPYYTERWSPIKLNQCISGPHLLLNICTISGVFAGDVQKPLRGTFSAF